MEGEVFSTSVFHICMILAFYLPLTGLSMFHRFGNGLAPLVLVTMRNI